MASSQAGIGPTAGRRFDRSRILRFRPKCALRLLAGLAAVTLLAACSSGSSQIADLGLQGRVVYTQAAEGLWQVDLQSGKVSQLWDVPQGGQLFGVAVSPDGADLALAYAPPNPAAGIPRADLYLANGDGSSPQPLVEHAGLYESFDYPTWSPDGQWLYFTRSDVFVNADQTFSDVILNIERVPAGGGRPEVVISNAEQASISADGTKIAYIHFSLDSYTRSLWVADIDGSNAAQVLPDYRFFDIASPAFSPDGQQIAFAGSGDLQPAAARPAGLAGQPPQDAVELMRLLRQQPGSSSAAGLVAWLSGAMPAAAHGLPWDYWTIPVEGGEPTKLTNWATDAAAVSWSPDGSQLAMMHLGGLFVQGRGDPVLLAETPLHGGLDWADSP